MFHFTEMFTRDRAAQMRDTTTIAAADPVVDYLVLRDGQPFAVLNATPTLAERTIMGFARATPEIHWELTRYC